jgi:hypothetical protein
MRQTTQVDGFAGLRLNTVMPVATRRRRERLLAMRRACGSRPLWVDLKARQLRVREFANTPYTSVRITHRVRCALPATAYFDNGRVTGKIVDIEGFELILERPVGRLIGPGESVNIPDSSLTYLDDDLLTSGDLQWLGLCKDLGIHHYMLSFVESTADVLRLRELDPAAVVMAKVESRRGLEQLESIAGAADWVMAARGDLFVEIAPPHEVDAAVLRIVEVGGARAVVGSRFLESLHNEPVPSLADLADVHRLREWGVKHIMLGDDLCFDPSLLFRATRIIREVWNSKKSAVAA